METSGKRDDAMKAGAFAGRCAGHDADAYDPLIPIQVEVYITVHADSADDKLSVSVCRPSRLCARACVCE